MPIVEQTKQEKPIQEPVSFLLGGLEPYGGNALDLSEDQIQEIYHACVEETPRGFKLNVSIMMMMFYLLTGQAQAYSVEAEVIVANSVSWLAWALTFAVIFGCFMTYTVVSSMLSGCRACKKDCRKVSRFAYKEYKRASKFAGKEYKTFRNWSKTEYASVKEEARVYAFASLAMGIFATFNPLKLITNSIPWLQPQGFRKDINRAGMASTGILSLLLLVLAPIFGPKKVMGYLMPIIDCLKQIPYASWIISYFKKWYNGEATFDDLPQTQEELREHFKAMNVDDDVQDDLAELNRLREVFAQKERDVRKGFAPPKPGPEVQAHNEAIKKREQAEVKVETPTTPIPPEMVFTEEDRDEIGKNMEEVLAESFRDVESPPATKHAKMLYHPKKKGSLTKEEWEKKNLSSSQFVPQKEEPKRTAMTPEQKVEGVSSIWDMQEQCVDADQAPQQKAGLGFDIKPQCIGDHCLQDYLDFCFQDVWAKQVKPWLSWIWSEIKSTPADIQEFFMPDARNIAADAVKIGKEFDAVCRHPIPIPDQKGNINVDDCCQAKTDINHVMKMTEKFEKKNKVPGMSKMIYLNMKWDIFKKVLYARRKILIKGGIFLACYWMLLTSMSAKSEPILGLKPEADKVANPQGVNRGGKRGHKKGPRSRKNVWNNVSPSGSENDLDDVEYEEPPMDDLYQRTWVEDRISTGPRERKVKFFQAHGQATPVVPPLQKANESDFINKVRASRRPVKAPAQTMEFVQEAKKRFEVAIKQPIQPQAFSAHELSDSIYKFYMLKNGEYQYMCSATHVASKLVVVMHALSEDVSTQYRIVNSSRTIDLFGKDIVVLNDQLAYFPINGFPTKLPSRRMKVMEESGIVNILGYGHGDKAYPESLLGYASPLGWCNAPTRQGDCSAPVLDGCGFVVGFWTHGIEQHLLSYESFGKFEPVTEDMITELKSSTQVLHTGLDFQSGPHKQ